MKAIIQCYTPQECERIARGEQTVKVCKTAPNEAPFKVYIYCTKARKPSDFMTKSEQFGYVNAPLYVFCNRDNRYDANGKVIGEYICNKVEYFDSREAEWAYAVAPSDIWCTMPMSETEAIQICKEKAFLTDEDIIDRFGEEDWKATFLHISEPKIYDEPRKLGEFSRFGYKPCGGYCLNNKCKNYVPNDGFYQPPECKKYGLNGCTLTHAPTPWCYVEDMQ